MLLDQFENTLALGLNVSLISDIFRSLFFFIDGIIYSLIPNVYGVIYDLYDLNSMFGDGVLNTVISNMSKTVYSFLAIYMFFRVAFSLITMLVDPSIIDSKDKGAKKIVANIMLCLVLIVVVPYAFKYAKEIQTKVIDEKIIEQVVVGSSNSDSSYDLGNEMALSVWSVFLRSESSSGDAINAYNEVFNSGSSDWNLTNLYANINEVAGGGISGIIGSMTGNNQYSLSYVFLLSTVAGIYILWMFITVMVDVAYRSIKFFALEIISPIAIVSYIDPDSGKKGVFSKWLNETVKTYISLFVRLFVFAFASVLLRTFSMSDLTGGKGLFANLIFILAIIAFIKTAPKFIDNLFGTSMSSSDDSNLMKALKPALGLAGVATGAVAGGISGAVASGTAGKNRFVGAVTGAWNGGKKGYSAGKKGGLAGATGVASNVIGSYGDAKKKYGVETDDYFDRLVAAQQKNVAAVNAAKSAAVDDLMANDGEKYNEILAQGAKVNGRKYGKGLAGDEGLENLLKKNAGGLAQDEFLHAGDDEYLMLRRAVAKASNDDAILSRVSARARSQYSADSAAYNSVSDKAGFVVAYEADTARMKYDGLDEVALRESYAQELQLSANNYINSERRKFDASTRAEKVNLLVNSSNMDKSIVSAMSDVDLASEFQRVITTQAQGNIDAKVSSFVSAASLQDKIELAVDVKRENIAYEVSAFDEVKLSSRFEDASEDRIKVKYGQSISNIEADAGKASGDAKKAKDALDQYLKSAKGKKAKNIDSAYSVADSKEKARELEEKRNQNNGQ